jgi:peptidyl-prolyl cis-trans isomerase SurA
VKSRTEPHRANLKEDYQRIQDEALAAKKEKIINAWIRKKIATTYVSISNEYRTCKFDNPWVNKDIKQ